ncbi:hypothetical protein BRADI_3g21742v3 [Brachypodium distachyon]|uniref:Uncharacterized protein n=1 Tax=Brachypodium distachyon TaxID=15368 RepID=A0A2K2CYQ5_BRADI|nr:hypothetical protein BRADI_3g21742v3 [Brachypodium distachyon]
MSSSSVEEHDYDLLVNEIDEEDERLGFDLGLPPKPLGDIAVLPIILTELKCVMPCGGTRFGYCWSLVYLFCVKMVYCSA